MIISIYHKIIKILLKHNTLNIVMLSKITCTAGEFSSNTSDNASWKKELDWLVLRTSG